MCIRDRILKTTRRGFGNSMLILVTYDVNTLEDGGKKRLRHVARACQDLGQRVQYSVFEIEVDPAQWTKLKARLEAIIRPEFDLSLIHI